MIKLVLLFITFVTIASSAEYKYEFTPLIGYNITEGNIGLDNHSLVGGEIQYNGLSSSFSPELSILYSKADYSSPNTFDTKVYRVALSGVYDFKQYGPLIPLIKAGIGFEDIKNSYKGDSPFIDLGVGAKFPFSDSIALKLEAMYMLNYNNAVDHNRKDSNMALLAGVNIAFGEKSQPYPTSKKEPIIAAKPMVYDDDKDGVINTKDKCPNTDPDQKVNEDGCFVDGDDDKDGVLNSKDECPNTPLGKLVYKDGCPESLNLNIHFSNNSARIDPNSYERIELYAKFLQRNPEYSVDIIGYTSNTGSDEYNLELSQKRAVAVRDMLITYGVDTLKVRAEGRGRTNPIASNETEEGRALNRRIEAEMTKD